MRSFFQKGSWAILLALLAAGPAVNAAELSESDSGSAERLRRLEGSLEQGRLERERLKKKTEDLTRELDGLRQNTVEAARTTQEYESQISDQEQRLTALRALETEKTAALIKRQRQLSGVLSALQRLARRPPGALLAQPSNPNDTVRTAILLRSLTPKIEAMTRELRLDLDALRTIRAEIGSERLQRSVMMGRLSDEHRKLKAMLARKEALQQVARNESNEMEQKLQAMAQEARDLRDLMQRLETERKRREAAERRERQTTGTPKAPDDSLALLPQKAVAGMPVRGSVMQAFGMQDTSGTAAKGVKIETRGDAQVTIPMAGLVVFAGPFRGYGQLLIVEHPGGYHTLLAGMTRIDSWAGQNLVAGEPVGIMGEEDTKPVLYFEIRRNGQAIDPLMWIQEQMKKGA